jgi:antitoxin Phd
MQIVLTSVITNKEVGHEFVAVAGCKTRFREFLHASLEEGPQIVTCRGVETAVLLSIDEWRRLNEASRPGLKKLFLTPQARHGDLASGGRTLRRRPLTRFK